jgi:hypothetical protein
LEFNTQQQHHRKIRMHFISLSKNVAKVWNIMQQHPQHKTRRL